MVLTVVLKSAGPADIGSAVRIPVFGTIHPDIFRFRAPLGPGPAVGRLQLASVEPQVGLDRPVLTETSVLSCENASLDERFASFDRASPFDSRITSADDCPASFDERFSLTTSALAGLRSPPDRDVQNQRADAPTLIVSSAHPFGQAPTEVPLPSDDGRSAIYDAIGSNNKPEPSALPSLVRLRPSRESLGKERAIVSGNMGLTRAELSAKWLELQSRIAVEQETLAACRLDDGSCPAAARRFLSIVELGRQHLGRARLGEINRAINLSIKPASDLAQYGVADFWSAPLATLSIAAGDCEDYAILKYVALREIGIEPDDLQLVIVHDIKRDTAHAVVAVRLDEEWLILDNRTLVMVNTHESQYYPLFVLDHRGVLESSAAAFRR